jgi:penicillin-binding protein 1A
MVTMEYALANSINTITAWLMKQYSPEAVTVLARHMGVKSELLPVPSLCLGVADLTLEEMTAAFAAFANSGVYIEPIVFTRIEDKNGNAIYDVTPRTEEALPPTSCSKCSSAWWMGRGTARPERCWGPECGSAPAGASA